MLNITNHQRNANQNHNEIPPHTCQNGYYQKDNKIQVLVKIWRKVNTPALLVEIQIGAASMENSMEVPWNLKIELSYNSAIPRQGIYPKKTKILIQKVMCTSMFIAALFTIAKIVKQPRCPSIDKWVKKIWYCISIIFLKILIHWIRLSWMEMKINHIKIWRIKLMQC